jgi:hypothetical protein
MYIKSRCREERSAIPFLEFVQQHKHSTVTRSTRLFKLASKVSVIAQRIRSHHEQFGLTLSFDFKTASSNQTKPNQTKPNQTTQPPSITMGNIISSIARGINAVLMAIVNVSAPSITVLRVHGTDLASIRASRRSSRRSYPPSPTSSWPSGTSSSSSSLVESTEEPGRM